jgi:hypothetical protein
MKDQHAKIAGYRDLEEGDLKLINHLKGIEHNCGVLLTSMEGPLKEADPEALRWLALGRTHIETGIMYAIKAVARPSNGLGRRFPDNRTREEIPVETANDSGGD